MRLLAVLPLLVLASCGPAEAETPANPSPPASRDTVRIYSSLPTKGSAAPQAAQVRSGIDLAISERGGRAGAWRVVHVALDSSAGEGGDWTAERERRNAQSAVADLSAVAYIGPYTSGATAVSLPITNKAGLLQVGVSATWPGLTQDGWNDGEPDIYYPSGQRNFARLVSHDAVQGTVAALWAADEDLSRVSVLSDGSSYSDGLADACSTRAQLLGFSLEERLTIETNDPAKLDVQLETLQAEAVFYAPSTVGQAVSVARALTQHAPQTRIFMSDTALNDQLLEQRGIDFSHLYIVYNGLTAEQVGASAQEFARRFEVSTGTQPGLAAANSYDAAQLVMEQIAKGAGRDRNRVREGFFGSRDYSGASGTISFDDKGDRLSLVMSGYRIHEGKFIFDRLLATR